MATTSLNERHTAPPHRLDRKVLALAAVVSLLTSPITAIWFLLLGPLVLVFSAIAAFATRRSLDRSERVLRTGLSVGVGLLVGPVVYVGLALV